MAEEPIKLFATRAERYPQPESADIVHGTARAVLASIPLIGGSITEVLSLVLAPAVVLRRDVWLKELADAVGKLEEKIEGFKIENLADNEAFVSASIQATKIAVGTHQRDKRDYLRNALLRVAAGVAPDEDLQQMYLKYIEEFTVTHIKVLQFLARWKEELREMGLTSWSSYTVSGVIFKKFPELRGKNGLENQIVLDLKARNLLNAANGLESLDHYSRGIFKAGVHDFTGLSNQEVSTDQWNLVTFHGLAFLEFVLTPACA